MMRVFSGIRPSGKLHLGNYLGAIKNWTGLQNEAEQAIFAVVDYHGITTPYDPQTYQQQIMDVVLDYLAAGIDPNKALFIRQSKVPQHTELAWLFNTITPVSWLDRLPTYKEQLAKSPKYNHMGLLDYPVLMAADILIYKSNLVPVGEDQLPHIDLTNEVAKKFNSMFGEVFPTVKARLTTGARIMSLTDPTKKMSKTPHQASPLTAIKKGGGLGAGQAGDDSCIFLVDTPDTVRAKIKKAVTDSGKEVKYDEQSKPAISNLMTIYGLLSSELRSKNQELRIKEIEKTYKDQSYADFKTDLAEVVVDLLKPFQEKRKGFEKDPDKVLEILMDSEEKARILASSTLKEVKEKMGLW